jgi:twitching motility protein PilT
VKADAQPQPAAPVPSKLEHLCDYLAYARAAGASDLHISAEVRPFLRLHGRIQFLDTPPLQAAETERLLFEVLSTEQKSRLLDKLGLEICLDIPGQGRYRATIVKQRLGWDGVFHIIRSRVPTLEELGLPDCLKRLTEYNQGLVLVTGPGNCGKTTTLAALVDTVNRTRDDHIITVERPIEYVHTPMGCQVTQREVGTHTESFAVALRAALREDPDVIMVGELRDLETLSMAISASETGHLVLGTLHTTSAARTVSRVVDGFPVAQQAQIRMMLSESLRGVISQQLVPRKDERGVALALEILFVTPAVSVALRDNKPFQIPSIIQTSRKMGMRQLDDSLLELASQGVIEVAEASRRADNKRLFDLLRSGESV